MSNFYINELEKYKTISSKKAFLTRSLKECLSIKEEMSLCRSRFYLGENKYSKLVEISEEIEAIIEAKQTLITK